MNADRWIFLLALCFVCVSSYDEQYLEDYCDTQTLSAPLGSSVLLPCEFPTSGGEWVSWAHTLEKDLVNLKSNGHIKFLDPKDGRLKAFPNQGSEGNYSICIDDLENSDLGWYRCALGNDCHAVELVAEIGIMSEEMILLIYISVGVAAFTLLSVGGYYCMKCILFFRNRTQDNMNNPVGADAEGASAPPVKIGNVPADQQLRGADNLIYENDDLQYDPTRNPCSLPGVLPDLGMTQPTQSTSTIYPDLNQGNFERMESQRTKQRFHTELFSRLRQASLSRHYYVNRGEISKQQATSTQAENHHRAGFGKKKVKKNCEYKNPIYNRSTDHLNQL